MKAKVCNSCNCTFIENVVATPLFVAQFGPVCDDCFKAYEQETTQWVESDIETFGDES